MVGFNKTCINQCPENYVEINQTCSCPNGSLIVNQEECVANCPTGYFANMKTSTCDVCNGACLTCFGIQENECLTCESMKYLLKGNCFNTCPDYYYADNGDSKMVCSKCKKNCQICLDNATCDSCEINYKYVSKVCKYVKEIKAEFKVINNPVDFLVKFPNQWDYFFKNYASFFQSVLVENLIYEKDYRFSTNYDKSEPLTIRLYFNYNNTFEGQKLSTIWLKGEDIESDNENYYYMDQNLTITLSPLKAVCNEYQYYSEGNIKFSVKNLFKYNIN
jgi:hypothetical protein